MYELTPREHQLLAVLKEHEGQTMSRDALALRLGLSSDDPFLRAIDTAVARLRKKIEPDPSRPKWLHTVHAGGYRWGARAGGAVLQIGRARVDLGRGTVERDGLELCLTTLETEVLEKLARANGGVVAPTELLSSKGGAAKVVLRLREKLGDPEALRTRRGAGYQLSVQAGGRDDRFAQLAWQIAECAGIALQFAEVVVFRRDGSMLRQVAGYGSSCPEPRTLTEPRLLPVGQGVAGTAANEGRVQRVDDTRIDRRCRLAEPREARSALAVPVLVAGDVVGVLDSEAVEPRAFTEAHAETLGSMARMMACALAA